jgi:phage gp46-like protein
VSTDRTIDPVTRDFVDATGGAFGQSDSVQNQIAFSYMLEYGSWEGDPLLGHRFKELARATNTVENRNRLRDLAKQAVQWLIDLGVIDSVEVTTEVISADGVAFEVDYTVPNDKTARRAGPFLIAVGGG